MSRISKHHLLRLLFWVVIINFVAQVPYYVHQYYDTSKVPPSLAGIVLMGAVLAWFLTGYYRLATNKSFGYAITLAFLGTEFLFYLQTQIVQAVTGHGILLHVLHPDGVLLFGVFLIGYINFSAAPGFIYMLVRYRREFAVTTPRQ